MIELNTPLEIIAKLALLIENERKLQGLQQKELAHKAGVPLPTYSDFIYKSKISLAGLIKLVVALRMFDNLQGLLKQREIRTLDEIKNEIKLPSRIVK